MHRLLAVLLVGFAASLALRSAAQEPRAGASSKPPAAAASERSEVRGLVVVTLDTVRADRLGCYGYFRDTTPNLDRLAAESLRFDGCRTPIAQTTPSHASILTGVGPWEHGVASNLSPANRPRKRGGARRRGDDEEESGPLLTSATLRTLAQALSARGVKTGGFVGANPVKKHTGLAAGFDDWTEPLQARRDGKEVIADAIRFLESVKHKPFFAWVHLFDAHEPFNLVPESSLRRYAADPRMAEWLAERNFPEKSGELEQRGMTVAQVNDQYDGALRYLDDQFAVLLSRLREPDLSESTALVVVADHGTSNGQHEHMGHGVCWDEQLRVPLFVRVPGMAPRVVEAPMSTLDLWPTVFALAPALADPGFLAQCRGRDVLGENFEPGPFFATAARRPAIDVVTVGRFKLLRDAGGATQLFDLAADPHERVDLAPKHPKIAARLGELLDREVERQKRWRAVHAEGAAPPPEMVEAEREEILRQLRELGYVERR